MLLHTEVMRQHLLTACRRRPGRTSRLSGLTGFEPTMRGEREYAFAGVGCSSPKAITGS